MLYIARKLEEGIVMQWNGEYAHVYLRKRHQCGNTYFYIDAPRHIEIARNEKAIEVFGKDYLDWLDAQAKIKATGKAPI